MHEVRLDGHRILAVVDRGQLRLLRTPEGLGKRLEALARGRETLRAKRAAEKAQTAPDEIVTR